MKLFAFHFDVELQDRTYGGLHKRLPMTAVVMAEFAEEAAAILNDDLSTRGHKLCDQLETVEIKGSIYWP
jgi:hypothetical protein